jgi:hypothetical protein
VVGNYRNLYFLLNGKFKWKIYLNFNLSQRKIEIVAVNYIIVIKKSATKANIL